MRKTTIFILISALLISLSACNILPGNTSSETTTAESTSVSATTETTSIDYAPVEQQPMISVSVPVVSDQTSAEDGKLLFTHTYQNISLVIPDQVIAEKITLDFFNQTDSDAEVSQLIAQAKDTYSNTPENFMPYWLQNIYEPMRTDKNVISLYGSYATYTGGAHGSYSYKALNYNVANGELISLKQILSPNATSDVISNLIIESLTKQKAVKALFDGFESIVSDLLGKNFPEYKDWFFSNSGLCFFYSPYEIGPFSSGDIVAEIPYNQLTNLLDDAYFPAEKEIAQGSVQAEFFQESVLDRFSQFAELSLQENGQKVLIYTDRLLYDVQLHALNTDNQSLPEECTLLSVYSLSPGDAIVIELPTEATLPNLLLQHTTDTAVKQHAIKIDLAKQIVTLAQP